MDNHDKKMDIENSLLIKRGSCLFLSPMMNCCHSGPLRSALEVSKACLTPKAPRKARSARLLESADLRCSIDYEAWLFDKDRKAKVNKALGLETDLTNTSVRSTSSVLPKARVTVSPKMTVQ